MATQGAKSEPLAFLNARLQSTYLQSQRDALERKWLKCTAWTMGLQQRDWEFGWASGGRNEETMRRDYGARRDRYVGNKLKPVVNRRLAQLVSAPPGWDTVPETPDYMDRKAAEIGLDLINSIYQDLDVYESLCRAGWWAIVTGNVGCRIAWNPTSGRPQEIFFDPLAHRQRGEWAPMPANTLPTTVQDQLREWGYSRMVYAGDLELKVLSPFEFIIPPYSNKRYRPWHIEAEIVHIDQLYDAYEPSLVDQVPVGLSSDDSSGSLWLTNLKKVHSIMGPEAGYLMVFEEDESVIKRELFYRPCHRFPEGRHIVDAGGVLLLDEPNPYFQFGITEPLVHLSYQTIGTGPYGMGMVEDLLDPQNGLNDIRQSRIDNVRLMGKPCWLIPTQSGVGRITNAPGQKIRYKHPFMPTPAKIDPVDNAGEQLNGTLLQDIWDISAQQDVTQAKVPPNLRSGVAISLLQERDDATITPVVRAWDYGVATIGDHILQIAARMYSDGRILRIYDADAGRDLRTFRSGVIGGNVRVVVAEQPRAPRSRALELHKILEGINLGAINPMDPMVKKQIIRSMELHGGWSKIFYLEDLNQRRAYSENEIFAELGPQGGAWPAVEPWEDHSIHLACHTELRLTDRWEVMPDEARLVLDAHCKDHENYLAQQQQAALAQMEAAKGGPGQKGRASQPAT